jgi:hypothetical protein
MPVPLCCAGTVFAQGTTSGSRRASYISFQAQGCHNTYPSSINKFLSVTGSCVNAPPLRSYHGFVRDATGAITVFDPPGAINTFPASINAGGAIAGRFFSPGIEQGFIRSPDGTFIVFDLPNGAGTVIGLTDSGTIAGSFGPGPVDGYLRSPQGEITSFDPPGDPFTSIALTMRA